VARSVKALGFVMLGLIALAGCDSTAVQSARIKLDTTREVAGRTPQVVTQANPQVQVTGAALVGEGDRTAIVVDLKSAASTPLTDVPVTVSVQRGDKTIVLNDAANLKWFQTHVPAIPAKGTTTWVLKTPGQFSARNGDQPLAVAGVPSGVVISSAEALPNITVKPAAGSTARRVRVVVENDSDIPQGHLQVYATSRDGDRYVAAGVKSLKRLGRRQAVTVAVPLTGRPADAVVVSATPTIFD
jgi:hypothetical protein